MRNNLEQMHLAIFQLATRLPSLHHLDHSGFDDHRQAYKRIEIQRRVIVHDDGTEVEDLNYKIAKPRYRYVLPLTSLLYFNILNANHLEGRYGTSLMVPSNKCMDLLCCLMLCILLGLTMYSSLYILHVVICLIFNLFMYFTQQSSFHFHGTQVYIVYVHVLYQLYHLSFFTLGCS